MRAGNVDLPLTIILVILATPKQGTPHSFVFFILFGRNNMPRPYNMLTGALPGFLLCCYVTKPAHLSSLHVLVYASLVTEKARCFGKLFGCCQDAS